MKSIQEIAKQMVAPGKGILAADESNETAGKRLEAVGVESTEDTRRQYRELFIGTTGIERYLSGVILYDETIRQTMSSGKTFVEELQERGILPGIKVDKSTVPFPGRPEETMTEGLDGLRERLQEYRDLGAVFAKWRAVFVIGKETPSMEAIHLNAIQLALYAKICQEEGIVPMIEPEVLHDGKHTLEEAFAKTREVLSHVMYQVDRFGVLHTGLILKTSMVLPGKDNQIATPDEVAEQTVKALKGTVPNDLAGVVFLSGGQAPDEATYNLDAIADREPLPWPVAFSFARAIQGPVLEVWRGEEENVDKARQEFMKRLEFNQKADKGEL